MNSQKSLAKGSRTSRTRKEPKQELAFHTSGSGLLIVLLALFFASGCAALVYEIVWFQLLELTIGSSAVSIAVLLATYMGGMCIGSLAVSRFIGTGRHPLRVYAVIEFGIAICGVLVLVLLPYAGGLYVSLGGVGATGLLLRGVLSAICLLPPTILMGATLPVVSRWVESKPRGVEWLGFLYGGNTLGAVAGCLLAGFVLLRLFDAYTATYVAVAINVATAAAALLLASATSYAAPSKRRTKSKTPPAAIWPVLVTIALSGFTALSAEVVWTRLLSLHLGATVYTYSLILAAILLGLGIGSYIGSFLTNTAWSPRILLGICQALLAIGIAWSAYLLTVVLPTQAPDPATLSRLSTTFVHDLLVSLQVVLPAALLWGASFPLALAAVAGHDEDPGRSVGLVYASNTGGAIIGSLWAPLIGMAWLGSQHIQQLLILTVAVSASLVIAPLGIDRRQRKTSSSSTTVLIAGVVLVAFLMTLTVRPVPGALVGYGPGAWAWNSSYGEFIYVGEGMNSSVAVSRFVDGVLNYHNAGKVQASSTPADLRLQRMLGHLTTLQQEDPESVLVIGCGSGVTAGSVCVDPRVRDLTIVDIEPLVPKAADEYFSAVNERVVSDPKTHVIIDDGRHFLMTAEQKFNAITCDPFDPWTKGAASLSTREFYEAVRDHLEPGGTVTVWVPLYQTKNETVKSEIATFMDVFPDAIVWDNVTNAAGDIVLSGRVDEVPIDLDAVSARVSGPDYQRVRESLSEIGFDSTEALFATFGARGDDMSSWAKGAQINTDRNLRLQYLAGEGFVFDRDDSAEIYADITRDRTWPEGLFTGSPETVESLRARAFGQ